ncbi:MAG: hypothetical protein GY778_27660 [bacterium]|nr:hypothetical protein [bacterium]
MFNFINRKRLAGGSAGLVVVVAVAIVTVSPVQARQNIRSAFFDVYPGAVGTTIETVPSFPTHCGVCHYAFGGGGPRNLYGQRLEAELPNHASNPNGRRAAVAAIENEDPDGDGFSTLTEVTDTTTFSNTPTFPGLTPANVGQVSNVDVSEIQNHLVPSTGGDTTPPSVTVLDPDGGEVLTANAGTTVQWFAEDASGVAAVDLYVSVDNGTTFKPIALSLANSGSHTWFPANRPTTQALFRGHRQRLQPGAGRQR